jgi:DNA-binding transcriptional MerR regulator
MPTRFGCMGPNLPQDTVDSSTQKSALPSFPGCSACGNSARRMCDEHFFSQHLFDSVISLVYNTVMKPSREPSWTIDELSGAVEAALAEGYEGPPNGRVRGVPDERTIRYYTTLGLLDRANEMKGRTALYGRRHLLQLVAIKKLQARGQTLAEIQRALLGQTDAALARMAGIKSAETGGRSAAAQARSARAFWREAPAAALASTPELDAEPVDAPTSAADRAVAHEDLQVLQGIELTSDVTLLLAAARALESEELQKLRTAAGPLIDLLARLQIISPRGRGDSK